MALTIERRNANGVSITFPVYHSIEELANNPPAIGHWISFPDPTCHNQTRYAVIVDIGGSPYIASYEALGGRLHLMGLVRETHPWR
ncbi:hypothetical protein HYU14_02555 [Candidatus Woesearchaeota archaeon]|nr:hypothetical protein [Candidatus Woesearchaeota archaeon]